MKKLFSIAIFAAVMAVFTFSSLPAHACKGNPNCPHHAEKKVEKKCKSDCTKPCCKKANVEKKCKKGCTKPCCKKANTEKKCTKHKVKSNHNDNSRYND